MGLFDLFKKHRSWVSNDGVWKSKEGKLAALRASAGSEGQALVLVVAHFPATLEALEQAFEGGSKVERARHDGQVLGMLGAPRPGTVCLTLARDLPAPGFEAFVTPTGEVVFLVAERHPLRKYDDAVEGLARSLPCISRVKFYLSLEDAVMKPFMSDPVAALLERLGVEEGEEMEHAAIGQAVESAQARIAERAKGDLDTDSAEAWLRVNVGE